MEDPPERIVYKSQYADAKEEEQGAKTYIFIGLCCVFLLAVLCCVVEVIRSSRKEKRMRRTTRSGSTTSGSQRWQTPYGESKITTGSIKSVGFKNVEDDKRPNGTHKNLGKEYKQVPNTEPKGNSVTNKGQCYF